MNLNLLPLLLLAALAGVSVVTQQVLNANLRASLDSPAWAGFVSYLVGTVYMVVLAVILRSPVPSLAVARGIPWWAWSGGFFGATFIALSILLVPKIGAATFIALLITGQMLAALAFDHFGWLGLVPRLADPVRLLGVAFLILGVVLVRR